MLIGRLICGICGGILCVLTPIYIGEIADKEIRNRLLTFLHLLINFGIMYAFVIDYFMEEHKIIWQYSLICSISCAPIAFIIFLPESSFYYLTKNDEIMAKKSLQKYRDNFDDFSEELEELKSLATIYKSKACIYINNYIMFFFFLIFFFFYIYIFHLRCQVQYLKI